MSERPSELSLPTVTKEDILHFVGPDILAPDHPEVWEQLGNTSPQLAREILSRVFHAAEGDPEKQRRISNVVTYALGVVGVALSRQQNEASPPAETPDDSFRVA